MSRPREIPPIGQSALFRVHRADHNHYTVFAVQPPLTGGDQTDTTIGLILQVDQDTWEWECMTMKPEHSGGEPSFGQALANILRIYWDRQ